MTVKENGTGAIHVETRGQGILFGCYCRKRENGMSLRGALVNTGWVKLARRSAVPPRELCSATKLENARKG